VLFDSGAAFSLVFSHLESLPVFFFVESLIPLPFCLPFSLDLSLVLCISFFSVRRLRAKFIDAESAPSCFLYLFPNPPSSQHTFAFLGISLGNEDVSLPDPIPCF